jgi:hypothetical protein
MHSTYSPTSAPHTMGLMTMSEMTKALLFYIKTFKICGADITFDTTGGVLKGIMELPPDQFVVDVFAARLEMFGGAAQGCEKAATMPVVRLVDGTGCMIKEMNPVDGGDMLRKLRVLIPPKVVGGVGGKGEAVLVEVLDLLHKIFKAVTH